MRHEPEPEAGLNAPISTRTAHSAQRRAQVRRRRAAAVAALTAVLMLVVLAVASGGGGAPAPRKAADSGSGSKPGALGRAKRAPGGAPATRAGGPETAGGSLLARENAAIDRLLVRQPFIVSGGTEKREIALTFDDGPGPYTPMLLGQLQRLHLPATFFEIGFMIHYFHQSLSRELKMDTVIGDHTEIHPMMAELSPSAQDNQIVVQTQQLARYRAPFPRLYRPPYGSFDKATFSVLRGLNMLMVLWTVDTEDYTKPGVSAIVHNALAGARPGAIILLHDAGGIRTETTAALPLIVRGLRARHYKLVTVPRLILDDPPRHPQALPTHLANG